jgi:fimbrial isopeptide formation D2 family protein
MSKSVRGRARRAKALVVLLLGFTVLAGVMPYAAFAATTPGPTPEAAAATQSEEPSEEPSATAEDPSPTEEPTPGDEPTPIDEPTTEPTAEPTAEPTTEPSEAADDDEAAAPQRVVPPPQGPNYAVITVKVGGNRTSLTAVGGLAGVTLGLFANQTGGSALFTCTSDVDGDCSFQVPDTQPGGANRDDQFWVRQISAAPGYFTNPNLGTGEGAGVASDPYRFQTGTQLRNGVTYRSTENFMIGTGNNNNEASSGIWQSSLNNPTFPAKCGINVALVLDLSGSVGGDLPNLKTAANTFVTSLVGTPSAVGVFTFATSAPAAGAPNTTLPLTPVSTAASATTVTSKINGLVLGTGQEAGTNWDRGIFQVAQSPTVFDVAVVITDGNPTFYAAGEGPGSRTRFREVENGIFSANAVKAENTKLIAFGVGSGIGSAGSGLNLRSISGPTLNTDYYQTSDYAAAGAQLRALALGSCTGSVSVIKQVVPTTAPPGTITGATPQGGWTFTAVGSTGITVDAPTSRDTAPGTGAANFPLSFGGGTTSGPVTLTETLQPGYTLQPVNNANATCIRQDTGANVPVTDSGTLGFTVTAASTYPVSCTVYNRAPNPAASVVLNKTWVVNGITYAEGSQPAGLVASGTINGTNQPWGVPRTGLSQGASVTLDESLGSLPAQCTVGSSRLTSANGATVDLPLPATQTLNAGLNTYGITNTLTCPTRLTLDKTVRFGTASPTSWTLTAIAPVGGALPGPTGTDGVTGTVTPGVTYTLREDGGDPVYRQLTNPDAVLRPNATGSFLCIEVQPDGTTPIPGFSDGLNGGVTVPFGTWVRCRAINETASLRLVKEVINDNGGTAEPSDWELFATPTGTFPPALQPVEEPGASFADAEVVNVRPGVTYSLSESSLPGYTNTDIECQIVSPRQATQTFSLQPGDVATCFFVNNDNPATLTLVKEVDNGDTGATAEAADWTLTADGPTDVSGPGNTPAVTNQSVSAGDYALSESGGPAGYTASDWVCEGGDVTGSTVTVANGADVTCTITNTAQQPTLTLVKTVTNDDGGSAAPTAWALSAAGPTPGISGATGSGAVTNVPVQVGDYDLSESGGPPGYTSSDWVCVGGSQDGATVTVGAGEDVTCTINNDDQPATLTLVKNVVNNHGGTAAPSDWTLSADGPTPISGGGNSTAVTGQEVDAGDYDLSESGGPGGYSESAWDCGDAALDGATVTVPNGGDVTCTITNDDQPAQLTLVKVVDPGETGSGHVPADWTLAATPNPPIDGQGAVSGNGDPTTPGGVNQESVFAGSYDLTEDGPPGFDPGDWVCEGGVLDGDSVTVPNGGNVVCTITNTAVSPTLTLVKEVVNQAGGTATPDQWTLAAEGPTPISGATGSGAVTDAPVQVGSYDLSETGPPGYTASPWACTGTGTQEDGNTVVLAEGQSATCTITNTDQPATLTLVKQVVNDNGGTAVPTDWTLTADGPTTISGTTGSDPVTEATVPAGDYDLSEAGPPGYTPSGWSCNGGSVTGSTVIVPSGGDVECTIVNDDLAATLTLVKEVDNGDTGATFGPADWILTAEGPDQTVTGPGNSPAVTAQSVDAGDYDLSETGGPPGYTESEWDCGDADLDGATVTVPNGGDVTCTITNTAQQPTLTLVKQVVNDNGGTATADQWTLTADGPTPVEVPGAAADEAETFPVQVGPYELSESGGPPGYAASGWVCVGGAQDGASVTVGVGDDVVCTITNDDQPATLTLVKEVDNGDTGATAEAADWTLTAEGPTPVSGDGNSPAVTNQIVDAGDYELSESDGPPGYTASEWDCGNAVIDGATVTVPNGGNVTCTITNTAQQPLLTLVKTVTNDDGGTATPADWTLTADGPTDGVTGVTGDPEITDRPVEIGEYDLSESDGPAGYAPGPWSCTGDGLEGSTVAIALGDDVTCTIDNDDQPATLTLVKDVDNGNTGATAGPGDWTLTADGPTEVTGPGNSGDVTDVTVPAGDYGLSESDGPAGYTASDWVCEGGELTGTTVTVPNGGAVTCTITNTAQQPTLTLVKEVTNDDGGTAEAADWTLTADGPTPVTGPGSSGAVTNVAVQVGDYALSESDGPQGYTASDWVCVGGAQDGASVTIGVGDNVVCTITNDDQPGTFEVAKTSDPASGSTVEPGDVITYTVTATHLEGVDLTDVVVNDDLSGVFDNATLVEGSIEASSGTATITGDTMTWNIPVLSDTETVTYQVRVNDDAYGVRLRNEVTAEGSENCDPTTGGGGLRLRAVARQATEADCSTNHVTPKWTVAKSSKPRSGSTVDPGSVVAYTLKATNVSDAVVDDAVVTDDLSDVLAHGTLVAVPNGATLDGTTLRWEVPTLQERGDTATLKYRVRIDGDAYDVTIGNVITPGPGGSCDPCATHHETPPPPPATPPGTTPPSTSGGLPDTGGPAGWLLWGGLLLVCLGAGVMFTARMRRGGA